MHTNLPHASKVHLFTCRKVSNTSMLFNYNPWSNKLNSQCVCACPVKTGEYDENECGKRVGALSAHALESDITHTGCDTKNSTLLCCDVGVVLNVALNSTIGVF